MASVATMQRGRAGHGRQGFLPRASRGGHSLQSTISFADKVKIKEVAAFLASQGNVILELFDRPASLDGLSRNRLAVHENEPAERECQIRGGRTTQPPMPTIQETMGKVRKHDSSARRPFWRATARPGLSRNSCATLRSLRCLTAVRSRMLRGQVTAAQCYAPIALEPVYALMHSGLKKSKHHFAHAHARLREQHYKRNASTPTLPASKARTASRKRRGYQYHRRKAWSKIRALYQEFLARSRVMLSVLEALIVTGTARPIPRMASGSVLALLGFSLNTQAATSAARSLDNRSPLGHSAVDSLSSNVPLDPQALKVALALGVLATQLLHLWQINAAERLALKRKRAAAAERAESARLLRSFIREVNQYNTTVVAAQSFLRGTATRSPQDEPLVTATEVMRFVRENAGRPFSLKGLLKSVEQHIHFDAHRDFPDRKRTVALLERRIYLSVLARLERERWVYEEGAVLRSLRCGEMLDILLERPIPLSLWNALKAEVRSAEQAELPKLLSTSSARFSGSMVLKAFASVLDQLGPLWCSLFAAAVTTAAVSRLTP